MKIEPVVICGPTATGKTTLALKLAKAFNGEIISADSCQVYREMAIGTGKDLPLSAKFKASHIPGVADDKYRLGYYEVEGVRIWLYDIVSPNQVFSAAEYKKIAHGVLSEVIGLGRTPIVTGGTGLYIYALFGQDKALGSLENLGTPPDWLLRDELGKLDLGALTRELRRVAPGKWDRLNESDRKNPRRLIRAIELAVSPSVPRPTSTGRNSTDPAVPPAITVGLMSSLQNLYQRIDQRVALMMEQGLLEEVRLLATKYGWEAAGMSGIGYRQLRPFFDGKETLDSCVRKIEFATHAYARRQLTWFKKDLAIHWFDVDDKGFDDRVTELVKSKL